MGGTRHSAQLGGYNGAMIRSALARCLEASLLITAVAGCGGSHEPPEAPAPDSSATKPQIGSDDSRYQLARNSPPDRPVGVTAGAVDSVDQVIAPLVQQARETYPSAKRRFLAGLPAGENFFVATRLRDDSGHFEQAFIHVESMAGDTISGTIASDLNLVRGYTRGDHFELKEADLVDWTISKPDGSEEGNVVGKYLDTLQR